MISVFAHGIGLYGPGLPDWHRGREVLAGRVAYQSSPVARPIAQAMPSVERRRSSNTVMLAVQVASEAARTAGVPNNRITTVFASAGGDLEVSHEICLALAQTPPMVSPTRFHNSVHNAAAGYWSIATQSHECSTSLSCFDASFVAGLLEAIAKVATEDKPVLLVAYDWPAPFPLHATRSLLAPFGVGLVLAKDRGAGALAELRVSLQCANNPPSSCDSGELESLRRGNPAARALPLLVAIARSSQEQIVLPYLNKNQCLIAVLP